MKKAALRTNADFEALYDRHWKYVYRLCFTYMNNVKEVINNLVERNKALFS